MSIGGYRFERHDRNRHGGGVGIYIQNNIHYDVRNDLPIGKLEIVCIEVKQKGSSPFPVLAWYNHNNFDELENVLKILDSENKEIILIGDTNCDNLAEEDCKNGMKKRLNELYIEYQFKQLIKNPTRVAKSSATLIDHFSTNNPGG